MTLFLEIRVPVQFRRFPVLCLLLFQNREHRLVFHVVNVFLRKRRLAIMPPVLFVYEHKVRFAGRFIFYDKIRVNSAVCLHLPGIEKRNLKVSLERLFQPNDRVQPAFDLFLVCNSKI